VTDNQFLPPIVIQDIARFFLKPTDGTYFCCDIFEPGTGYLFTDCGGHEAIVLTNKLLNDTSFRNMQLPVNYVPSIWDFSDLTKLLDA